MQFQRYGPGKFSDNVQEYLHSLTMDGADEEQESDGAVHYLLHLTPEEQAELQQAGGGYARAKSAIVSEDHSGFVTAEVYPTDEAGAAAFEQYKSQGGGTKDPDEPHPPIGDEEESGPPPDEGDETWKDPEDNDDLPPPPDEDDYELHPDLPPPAEDAVAPPVDDRAERLMGVLHDLHDKITQAMALRREGNVTKAVQLEEIVSRMIADARSEGYGAQAEDVELLTHSGDGWDEIESELRDVLDAPKPDPNFDQGGEWEQRLSAPPANNVESKKSEALRGPYWHQSRRIGKLRSSARAQAASTGKHHHVMHRAGDKGDEEWEVVSHDAYPEKSSGGWKRLYTAKGGKPKTEAGRVEYPECPKCKHMVFVGSTHCETCGATFPRVRPKDQPKGDKDAKTEAKLKGPSVVQPPQEPPVEQTVVRKPFPHQSQCSRCGHEGRVYTYGHDREGHGTKWLPGKFCGKSCFYGYHSAPPAASAMAGAFESLSPHEVIPTMKPESIDPASPAYRARVAMRLAAGGVNPKRIMEDLFGDGPDIGMQNSSSLYMLIQPNDKVTVTGPDGQPMAGVSIRKTDDGSGWVLDVQGAQGMASKETVVSVDNPVANIDEPPMGDMPDDGGGMDDMGAEDENPFAGEDEEPGGPPDFGDDGGEGEEPSDFDEPDEEEDNEVR